MAKLSFHDIGRSGNQMSKEALDEIVGELGIDRRDRVEVELSRKASKREVVERLKALGIDITGKSDTRLLRYDKFCEIQLEHKHGSEGAPELIGRLITVNNDIAEIESIKPAYPVYYTKLRVKFLTGKKAGKSPAIEAADIDFSPSYKKVLAKMVKREKVEPQSENPKPQSSKVEVTRADGVKFLVRRAGPDEVL